MSHDLILTNAARQAIAQAKSIDELKDIRDKAEAVRLYARQAQLGVEMINDATEIKLRAERRAGEMLKQAPKNKGAQGNPNGQGVRYHDGTAQTYGEIGITKNQAARWQEIAEIPEDVFEQTIYEQRVAQNELSTVGLVRKARELKAEKTRDENRALVKSLPDNYFDVGGKFRAIVIDPPWDWGDEGDVDQFGRAKPQYATMTLDEIRAMPVGDMADENAHLYLWITNRSLPKGFDLLDAWGFRYITCLTWCKPSIGMGNYFRGSTEQVLFGVRGSLGLLRHDMGTWFQASRGKEHSAKPNAFFEMVEQCSPGPYLELFARQARERWVTRGAEIARA